MAVLGRKLNKESLDDSGEESPEMPEEDLKKKKSSQNWEDSLGRRMKSLIFFNRFSGRTPVDLYKG